MKRFTLAVSVGPWGGFYARGGFFQRLCLGWFALTFVPVELDDLMKAYAEGWADYELTFYDTAGLRMPRYARWHATRDEAVREAHSVLASLPNRVAHPATIYRYGSVALMTIQ
jgi:hypothetical protein